MKANPSLTKPDNSTHTLDEVAEITRTSRRFIHLEIARGKLRALHLSKKCTRVRASDLAAYLEAH